VPRIKHLNQAEFKRDYLIKGRPVVIEGGAKDWKCCEDWSFDFFRDRYGEEEILYVHHEAIEQSFERHRFGHILDQIQQGNDYYYRFYPLLQRHPEHIRDFDYEWLLDCRHKCSVGQNFQIMIGGKQSYTPLHNAFSCNLFCQVEGEKEWFIYPPSNTIFFDPDPAENVYRNASYRQGAIFNPFEPDYDLHPLLQYIDRYHVVLEPGDILFNPSYWWHSVRNPTDSIGVGYRWFPPWQAFKQAPLYLLLDLTARNPSIVKSLKLANKDVNLIQLAQTGQLEAFLADEKQGLKSF